MKSYVVVGSRPWNRVVFEDTIQRYPGHWAFFSQKEQLTPEEFQAIGPRYVFFLHWSYKVPAWLYEGYECVCFHMTDVPYGRGGSPLQNLILRGHHQTKLTALQMVEDFDAGPVYLKQTLSLEGSAQEIYVRATHLAAQMILEIIRHEPEPVPQSGPVVIFKRRKPHESLIPELQSPERLFDFIRMLDADGYPQAFLVHQNFRYEFSKAELHDGSVVAQVRITPEQSEDQR